MKIGIKNKQELKYIDTAKLEIGDITLLELHNEVKKQQDVILSLLKISQNELHAEQDKYNGLIKFLSDYLEDKTTNSLKDEKSIREQISRLLVANTEPIDNVLIVDGYISKVESVGTLIRPIDIPDDIANRYWKLVEGKFILDKEKYNALWSVI